MQETEYAILELFRKNPNAEVSTTDIVKNIESEEYGKVTEALDDRFVNQQKLKTAKRLNAQLHRKVLYYLNKLVSDSIIHVSREGKKGEKFFVLTLEAGEEMTLSRIRRRPITIVKPNMPTMPIEGYEQKGIIHRLEAPTWIDRLNSIIIDCGMLEENSQANKTINTCFLNINDALCLNNFEKIISKDVTSAITFLTRLNASCSDYGKLASIVIDVTNIKNPTDVFLVMKVAVESKLKNLQFIFDITQKEYQEHSSLFESLINLFSKTDLSIYFKNQGVHRAPYFIGRAGPYTFDEASWSRYKRDLWGNIPYLVCSQSTVMVDAERFYIQEGKSSEAFNNLIERIINSLLSSNIMQRANCNEYFESLIKLNDKYTREYFMFSRNYIRFWNYGWKRPDFDQNSMISLFKEAKSMIDKFCSWEETIYKSCGMPTRFKVAFSCAFEEFIKDIFSKSKYSRFYIHDIKDFYRPEVKEILNTKEKLFKYFDGGDLISLYKTGSLDVDEVLREVGFLLSSYNIPFFRLNFNNIQYQDISLNSYLS